MVYPGSLQTLRLSEKRTLPVVKAEVDSIVHHNQRSFGVALSIVAGFSVAHQRDHMFFEELLYFSHQCIILEYTVNKQNLSEGSTFAITTI